MSLVDCVSNGPLDYSLGAHQLDLYLYVLVIVLCNVPRTEASAQPLVSLSSRTKLLARIQNAFVGETRRATVDDSRYKLPQFQMLHSSSCFYCRGVVMHTCALHIAHCRPVRLDRRHFRHGLVLVPSLDRARTGDGRRVPGPKFVILETPVCHPTPLYSMTTVSRGNAKAVRAHLFT